MQHEDGQFENYLREFEPRRPKPLVYAIDRSFDLRRLAAAAAVLLVLGASAWFGFQKRRAQVAVRVVTGPQQSSLVRPPALRLTQMAVEDPLKLDAELTEESRRILPNFRSKESTLRVLAKE